MISTEHTCHMAPLCAYWFRSGSHPEDPGACIHDSCMEIAHDQCMACYHEAMAADDRGEAWCDAHGATQVAEYASFTGFAGGRSYAVTLACGCTDLDESNDIAAAY